MLVSAASLLLAGAYDPAIAYTHRDKASPCLIVVSLRTHWFAHGTFLSIFCPVCKVSATFSRLIVDFTPIGLSRLGGGGRDHGGEPGEGIPLGSDTEAEAARPKRHRKCALAATSHVCCRPSYRRPPPLRQLLPVQRASCSPCCCGALASSAQVRSRNSWTSGLTGAGIEASGA